MIMSAKLWRVFALCCAITLVACGNKNTGASDTSQQSKGAVASDGGQASPADAAKVEAPDFTLTDIQGQPLSLRSLRGKYVVLDFWGSWCGWCIKGMPKMKECYDKYKGKLEIVGIDCGDTDEAWRKAVDTYQLPWLHVFCPENASVLGDYDIQGFPTKVVVAPDGTLDKVVIGEDPEFYTYLDQILG